MTLLKPVNQPLIAPVGFQLHLDAIETYNPATFSDVFGVDIDKGFVERVLSRARPVSGLGPIVLNPYYVFGEGMFGLAMRADLPTYIDNPFDESELCARLDQLSRMEASAETHTPYEVHHGGCLFVLPDCFVKASSHEHEDGRVSHYFEITDSGQSCDTFYLRDG